MTQTAAESAEFERELNAEVDAEMEYRARTALWADQGFALRRFCIRSLRIVSGIVIGVVALYCFDLAVNYLSKPFAQLSPLGLAFGLLLGIIGVSLTVGAFQIAFGEGQTEKEALAAERGALMNKFRADVIAMRTAKKRRESAFSSEPTFVTIRRWFQQK